MKTIKFLILFLLFATGLGATAQQLTFKILAARGEVAVQKAGASEFAIAKTGATLSKGDKLMLADNSYVGLVTQGGKTTELKSAGVYNVDDLAGNVKADNSTMAQKYVAYVFDNLRAGTDAHAHNMSITGSVERSVEQVAFDISLPTETRVIPMSSSIYWTPRANAETLTTTVLKVYNLFDEEIASFKVDNNQALVDFKSLGLAPEEVYKLQVTSEDGKLGSSVVTIQTPSASEMEKLNAQVSELKAELDENSAISNMVFATFLENNGLYLAAMSYYKKAIMLEPEVVEYQETYNAFLNKMGLSQ